MFKYCCWGGAGTDNAVCALVYLPMCTQASVLETMVKLIKLFDDEVKRAVNLLTLQKLCKLIQLTELQRKHKKMNSPLNFGLKKYTPLKRETPYTLFGNIKIPCLNWGHPTELLDKHWSSKQHQLTHIIWWRLLITPIWFCWSLWYFLTSEYKLFHLLHNK